MSQKEEDYTVLFRYFGFLPQLFTLIDYSKVAVDNPAKQEKCMEENMKGSCIPVAIHQKKIIFVLPQSFNYFNQVKQLF